MNAILTVIIVLITKRVQIPLDHFVVYVQLVTPNRVLLAKVSFVIRVNIWSPYYFKLKPFSQKTIMDTSSLAVVLAVNF